MIVGENGTGKSTIVRQVLAGLDGPKGVYFNCPSKLVCQGNEVDIRGATGLHCETMATFCALNGPLFIAA